jgi:hypothetical protein
MKYISNLFVILILVVFSVTVGTGESVYTATESEELFGTWVNTDYKDGMHAQMYIQRLGENERYSSVNDEEPTWTAETLINQKWTDSNGNIWYKIRWKAGAMGSGFSLIKISDSGKTLERVWSQWEHPKALDISDETYRIYYRK